MYMIWLLANNAQVQRDTNVLGLVRIKSPGLEAIHGSAYRGVSPSFVAILNLSLP